MKNVLGTATADFWITVTGAQHFEYHQRLPLHIPVLNRRCDVSDEMLNETAAATVGALIQAEGNAKFWAVVAVCLIFLVTIVYLVVVVVRNRNRKWFVACCYTNISTASRSYVC